MPGLGSEVMGQRTANREEFRAWHFQQRVAFIATHVRVGDERV